MLLNENIKTMRKNLGLSQIEFANKIGVTKQCVSNWENDNVLPSIEMLIKIATFFNVSTDYMLGIKNLDVVSVKGLDKKEVSHINQIIDDIRKQSI